MPNAHEKLYGDGENIRPNNICPTNLNGPNDDIFSPTKKMKLSDTERNMEGAPEGNLYDITVLDDDDIKVSIDPVHDLTQAISDSASLDASWAKKYYAIETFRKLLLHHTDAIMNTLESVSNAAISAVESLRSCSIRNGMLCIRSLHRKCSESLSDTSFKNTLIALIYKVGSGPKFITDLANDCLHEIVQSISEPKRVIQSLSQIIDHKNAEICSKSCSYISDCTVRLKNREELDDVFVLQLIPIFKKGIRSKRSEGKEKSRTALIHLNTVLPQGYFQLLLEKVLSSTQVTEVLIELNMSITTDNKVLSRTLSSTGKQSMKSSLLRKSSFKDIKKTLKNQSLSKSVLSTLETKT